MAAEPVSLLARLKLLELAQFAAGHLPALPLADFSADVIKIEPPLRVVRQPPRLGEYGDEVFRDWLE